MSVVLVNYDHGQDIGVFVTPACMLCGKMSEVTLNIDDVSRWRSGEYVHTVWPNKSADERELLMTGTHGECWEKMFGDEE